MKKKKREEKSKVEREVRNYRLFRIEKESIKKDYQEEVNMELCK